MNKASGATRAVIEAALDAIAEQQPCALAIVVETIGSTYVRRAAAALFRADSRQIGWLSGGCLEPEIARRAQSAATNACVEWMEIDTRDDEDLFAGSAVGCRGRLRLVLLPVVALDGWQPLASAWLAGSGMLEFTLDANGQIDCEIAGQSRSWQLPSNFAGWEGEDDASRRWQVELPAPPGVLVFGAGPETPLLIPLLRSLGWMTSIVESRPRWQANAALADHRIEARPESAIAEIGFRAIRAALIMQHNFEMDLEALQALASTNLPFIGLLGPKRRRDDLFKILPADVRDSLQPRLHSPIGLDL
ncbi:MAG TPA: XdhC family protein, partial [Dokdonella sp.]|uniref:XdhC family protein n=1 Tax=Dokdonella sp. TaxID=2291710 RepID=UPI002D8004ED